MGAELLRGARAVMLFTLLLGLAYPLAVTGISQVAMPGKADGSLLEREGEIVGSELIGQDFAGDPGYFQSRPTATGYTGDATYFNNQGPNQRKLARQITRSAEAYVEREAEFVPGLTMADVPADAATTSASGIDPHISLADAEIQANRVAGTRGIPLDRVEELIDENTDDRSLGFLGTPGVAVLPLNLALDEEDGS